MRRNSFSYTSKLFSKIVFTSLISVLILSSCVLMKERKSSNSKSLEYEISYDPEKADDILDFSSAKSPTQQNASKTTTEQAFTDEVWYHPNPWWRIKTEPFLVSRDSLKTRLFAPQYGFSSYIHPISKNKTDAWGLWKDKNYLNHYNNSVQHAWQGFVSANKEIFQKHPEYLAEKDGVRLGYGKTTKLCVSNVQMQQLYIKYVKELIQKNPNKYLFSVEPSDGAGLCTCSSCSKIGKTAEQPYYLANIIAKAIKRDYPDKQLGILAYYKHAEVPSFKLENNIKVVIAVQGFQDIYSPLGIISAWGKHHRNIGIREFYLIPQHKGETPRLNVSYFNSNINFMRQGGGDVAIYEAGTNINAIIVASLLSKIMMNPHYTWDEVFEKFLDDTFEGAKEPMRRLLSRWHTYSNYNTKDIHYSLYDLQEASALAQTEDEKQRIRDFKAYLLYIITYYEWNEDRDDRNRTIKFFDFINNISNRNVTGTYALTRLFTKHFSSDPVLNEKYNHRTGKNWVKYYSDQDIDNEFKAALKKYTPQRVDFLTINELGQIAISNSSRIQKIKTLNIKAKNRFNEKLYIQSRQLSITPIFNQKNTPTSISIYNSDGSFVEQKLLNDRQKWTINIPQNGIYTITQHRAAPTLKIEGEFIPFTKNAKLFNSKDYDYFIVNSDRQIVPAQGDEDIHTSEPYFIISEKIKN